MFQFENLFCKTQCKLFVRCYEKSFSISCHCFRFWFSKKNSQSIEIFFRNFKKNFLCRIWRQSNFQRCFDHQIFIISIWQFTIKLKISSIDKDDMYRVWWQILERRRALSHASIWHSFSEISRSKSRISSKRQNAFKFFNFSIFLPSLHIFITHLHCLHFLLKFNKIDMSRKRVFDDLNHVIDASTIIKKSKTTSSKPKSLSSFTLMKIHDLVHERDKLFINVIFTSYRVFSLFFNDTILQRIVENINEYAAKHASKKDKSFARKWYFISKEELRAYIATYIYMRIHNQSKVSNYWNRDSIKSSLHSFVYDQIELCRWEQIDRFLRISKFTSSISIVFEKLEKLSEHLRHTFKQYWIIETHFVVDESIQRFQGRSTVTVNISSKSVSKEYKVWVLINADYVLNWLFHATDDKYESMNLNDHWIKIEEFSKTQVVVLNLMIQQDIFDLNKYVVWLNNLFTSTRLLSILRDLEFEVANIVRVIKTKRNELKEKHDIEAQKQQKKKNRNLDTSLSDLKLKYEVQFEWNQLYEIISIDKKITQFAWKDQQMMLFISTIHDDQQKVERFRRKSALIFINARTSRTSFDNLTIKEFFIFDFIDLYNHFMNDVDVIDQFRCYYDTQRVYLKIWKSLWHFLLNTTIINSYKIINIIELRSYAKLRKHDSHKLFRIKLIQKLYDYSTRVVSSLEDFKNYKKKKLIRLIRCASSEEHDLRVKLSENTHYCVSCSINHRIVQKIIVRKFLQKFFLNNILTNKRRQRFFKFNLNCKLCRMYICKSITCWREHLKTCMISN